MACMAQGGACMAGGCLHGLHGPGGGACIPRGCIVQGPHALGCDGEWSPSQVTTQKGRPPYDLGINAPRPTLFG